MCVGSLCEWLLCLLSVEGTSQSEVAAASQLVEAIRSKRPVEELLQVLESSTAHLPAVQGDFIYLFNSLTTTKKK